MDRPSPGEWLYRVRYTGLSLEEGNNFFFQKLITASHVQQVTSHNKAVILYDARLK
jgi:hypothetical protein